MAVKLLTTKEMAAVLRVPVSWLYHYNRQTGEDAIPFLRIGKYCRYIEEDVLAWLKNKKK